MGWRIWTSARAKPLDPTRPDALYDAAWYFAAYPDVAAATRDGWGHFVRHGEREGRSPGPGFDAEYYRRTYLALEGTLPFTHYATRGRAHGHAPRALDLTANQTLRGIQAALQGRLNPILLLGNDARSAGAPLLLLEIARRLRSRGWSPVFLLNEAGPLYARFAALGPTMVAAEGWNLRALGAALPAELPILANTSWGGFLADRLGVASRSIVLIHEMPDYLIEHGLLDAVGRAHTVIASMPRTEDELARLLAPAPRLKMILPGMRAPTASRRGERRVRRLLSAEFGVHGHVYVGAGYADRRKGFDLFIDAAESIAEREPDAVFVWLGELGSWARARADHAQADGLRLALPGFRADADDWYAAADVYLLTSRQDPGPTTVMHAASVGVPFVGLRADIGLIDLVDVTAATGEFVPDTAALVERAVQVADSESRESRRRRAEFSSAYRSLDVYVDDLEEVIAGAASSYSGGRRAGRLAVSTRLATLELMRVPAISITLAATRRLVAPVLRSARAVAPRAVSAASGLRKRRLVSIAVVQSGRGSATPPVMPASALIDARDVRALDSGDRAWLATPDLLPSLRSPADLHILRSPDAQPWPLIRALESSAGRVARVTQHDVSAPPRWAETGGQPPRPRRTPGSVTSSRAGVVIAPHEPVLLPRSVGVFVHIYYLDLAEQIAERIAMITHPIELYVSTEDEQKAEQIRRILPTATVRVFPNRGRDIAPKVYGFAREHAAHDVVLHLHTKRSPHRSDLSGWFAYLLDCLLPSPEGINAVLALFAEVESLGMVSPALYPELGAAARWGPNRAIAEVLTWGTGWPPLPGDHTLAFAAGSMFWARTSALAPLQDLAIPLEAFGDSHAADGTLAHAVERLIGVSCDVAGLDHIAVAPAASVEPGHALTAAQVRRRLTGRGRGRRAR